METVIDVEIDRELDETASTANQPTTTKDEPLSSSTIDEIATEPLRRSPPPPPPTPDRRRDGDYEKRREVELREEIERLKKSYADSKSKVDRDIEFLNRKKKHIEASYKEDLRKLKEQLPNTKKVRMTSSFEQELSERLAELDDNSPAERSNRNKSKLRHRLVEIEEELQKIGKVPTRAASRDTFNPLKASDWTLDAALKEKLPPRPRAMGDKGIWSKDGLYFEEASIPRNTISTRSSVQKAIESSLDCECKDMNDYVLALTVAKLKIEKLGLELSFSMRDNLQEAELKRIKFRDPSKPRRSKIADLQFYVKLRAAEFHRSAEAQIDTISRASKLKLNDERHQKILMDAMRILLKRLWWLINIGTGVDSSLEICMEDSNF